MNRRTGGIENAPELNLKDTALPECCEGALAALDRFLGTASDCRCRFVESGGAVVGANGQAKPSTNGEHGQAG